MAQQSNLFPPNPSGDPRQDEARRTALRRGPVSMLVRIEALVRVIVRLYLGLLVTALPWLAVWAQNNLWTYSPILSVLAGNGFVRGVISGMGLLNLWMAIEDARSARELF